MQKFRKMVRKNRKYRLKKTGKKYVNKKLLSKMRWNKLIKLGKNTEVKQTCVSYQLTCQNQVTSTLDLLAANLQANIIDYPALGTADTSRIGDSILVKSATFNMILKLQSNINTCWVRVVFFYAPNRTSGFESGFFKFGLSAQFPPTQCSVDLESFNVVYDKTFHLKSTFTNLSVPTKDCTGELLIRGTIMRNQKVEFYAGLQSPKHARHRLICAVIPCVYGGITNGTVAVSSYLTVKLNYAD